MDQLSAKEKDALLRMHWNGTVDRIAIQAYEKLYSLGWEYDGGWRRVSDGAVIS